MSLLCQLTHPSNDRDKTLPQSTDYSCLFAGLSINVMIEGMLVIRSSQCQQRYLLTIVDTMPNQMNYGIRFEAILYLAYACKHE